MSDPVVLLSTGDVVGPAGGVTDNSMVLFNGTSGKLIKGNNAVVTAQGLALLDDVDAAANRATIGLNNVNNTSDVNKPVSTPQQNALDTKLNLTGGVLTGQLNGTRVRMTGTGNDYDSGAYEVAGNGAANTVFPTIGFHQPGTYGASMQLRGAGDFRFYAQGAATYANVTAANYYGTDYHASGLIDRLEGGNPTNANQAIGSSSSGSYGQHCFGARAYGNVAGYACYFGRVDGVNPTFASWYYYGSPVGTITTNGSSTSYNTTSDYRLKADVTDLGYSLERIQGLKPKAYRWLSTDKWGAGFLAHELAVVMPDAVTGEKDAVKSILDEAGEVIGEEVVPQVVDYSKIVVYLVGAIQEQQAQIDSLVSRIAKLEDTTA